MSYRNYRKGGGSYSTNINNYNASRHNNTLRSFGSNGSKDNKFSNVEVFLMSYAIGTVINSRRFNQSSKTYDLNPRKIIQEYNPTTDKELSCYFQMKKYDECREDRTEFECKDIEDDVTLKCSRN